VTAVLEGDGFRLRRATAADVEFMGALASHEDVEPFMAAVSAREPEALLEEVRRAEAEPATSGRFVVEMDGRAVGVMAFDTANRRSRIAHLHGLMLHPDARGRGVADAAARLLVRHLVFDLGFHRVQLECYGFNERAIRHAERSGFVREGVRRKAYRRHGHWVDGVLFGIVREDLEGCPGQAPGSYDRAVSSPARRWADGWKRGWEEHDADAIAALYAEDAVDFSAPFRPPNVGREGVHAYAEWAFADETDQELWFGTPVEDDDRAVVEWWATRLDGGRESTLAGCTVLRFGADGLVAESRNYWHEEEGRRGPPEGWGG
jgi:RimJ/RimL family protein N-acetyltransferase